MSTRSRIALFAGLATAVFSGAMLPLAAAQEPPKVERLPIVDKAIAFAGGDLYEHSESELRICSASGCYHLQVRVDGEHFEYVVEGEVRGVARRVRVTNDTTERWDDGRPVELTGDEVQRTRDFAFARVYFPYLPYRLNDPSVYKQDLGLERWGERQLHKVKVTFAAGSSSSAEDEYLYWFDPETGRLEQFAYSFGSGERAGVRLRQPIEWRRVGGILFSDQRNLGASAPGIRVDVVTPEFAEGMEEVSVVKLSEIEVEPLGD